MSEVIKVIGKNVYVRFLRAHATEGWHRGGVSGTYARSSPWPRYSRAKLDGLENDLDKMDGIFLKRGQYTFPLNEEKKWALSYCTGW
jgi:V/A-type H+-transporting ATPase subunit A